MESKLQMESMWTLLMHIDGTSRKILKQMILPIAFGCNLQFVPRNNLRDKNDGPLIDFLCKSTSLLCAILKIGT
jgi:hypothetical protein